MIKKINNIKKMEGFKLTHNEYGSWYFTTGYQIAKFLNYKNYTNFYQLLRYHHKKGKYVFSIREWLVEPFDISEVPQKYIDRSLDEVKKWYSEQPEELKNAVNNLKKILNKF